MSSRYAGYSVTLAEMPGYIALVFSLTGCKIGCKDCHSKHLWDGDTGTELTAGTISSIARHYEGLIDGVVFLGDIEEEDFAPLLSMAKKFSLTTCIYTGKQFKDCETYFKSFDFVKYGEYRKDLGGLDSPTTNQRYVRSSNMEDLTYLFNGDV